MPVAREPMAMARPQHWAAGCRLTNPAKSATQRCGGGERREQGLADGGLRVLNLGGHLLLSDRRGVALRGRTGPARRRTAR